MFSSILSGISYGILSGISSSILFGISHGILSGILSNILFSISFGILSGRWGPVIHTELGRSPVEVQRCTLSWAARRLRSSRLRSSNAHSKQNMTKSFTWRPRQICHREWRCCAILLECSPCHSAHVKAVLQTNGLQQLLWKDRHAKYIIIINIYK